MLRDNDSGETAPVLDIKRPWNTPIVIEATVETTEKSTSPAENTLGGGLTFGPS